MDIRLEAALRTLGMFLGVYFTLGWGQASKPDWDTPLMIFAIVLAILANYTRM